MKIKQGLIFCAEHFKINAFPKTCMKSVCQSPHSCTNHLTSYQIRSYCLIQLARINQPSCVGVRRRHAMPPNAPYESACGSGRCSPVFVSSNNVHRAHSRAAASADVRGFRPFRGVLADAVQHLGSRRPSPPRPAPRVQVRVIVSHQMTWPDMNDTEGVLRQGRVISRADFAGIPAAIAGLGAARKRAGPCCGAKVSSPGCAHIQHHLSQSAVSSSSRLFVPVIDVSTASCSIR